MSIVINDLKIEGRTEGRGLSSRKSVRAATVVPGVLGTAFADGQTIDGVLLTTGDRILLKNQVSGLENGVYVVQASGAPARDVDFDEEDDVLQAYVLVEEGTKNAGTGWLVTGTNSVTVNTDPLNFILITGDVSGQLSSTDNAIPRWNGTDGYEIQDSSILIDDSNNMTGLQYLQFNDITAPSNPSAGQGRLYKKTGDDGIFWKPDAAGPEVDLTADGGEDNTMSNVGTAGVGVFKQKTGVNFELKRINAGSNKLSVTDNVVNNRIDVDVVEANIDHDALTNFVANEHIDHSSVTITAGVALSGGGDLTASRTIDLDIPELTAESTIDPATDLVVVYDDSAGAHRKVLVQDIQAMMSGQANTASNEGVGGVGTFIQKTGVNLEFKNINAGSNKVTITDDVANNEIDIDLVEANIDHDALLNFVANEHIDHSAVTITAGIGLAGGGDITASRTIDLDIPELTTEATVDPAADFVALYDTSAGAHRKVLVQDLQDGVGEANTASNVGTGEDIFKQKTGVDLEFRGIEAGSSKVTTAVNGDNIDIDVVEANIDHDALLNYVADEHVDHSTVDITAGIGLSGGGDITASRTIDLDIPELTTEAVIDPAADFVAVYDASALAHRKVLIQDIQSVEGETNTASNVGVGGVGPFKQKTGVDLEFKNINAGSNKVSVTDDVANNEIDIDVVEANIDHDALDNYFTDEHIDHGTVVITAGVGLAGGGDITASRTIDLDINELTASAVVDSAADYVALYDASEMVHRKVLVQDLQNGVGEANTASNVGTGEDIFKQKTGVDLEFRGIEAGSSKVTTAVNGDNIDIDVIEANIDHDALLNYVANEHVDHSTVSINAGVGLAGGGDLTATRTIDLDIDSLTPEATVDPAADYVALYDASAGAHRKVLVQDIDTAGVTGPNSALDLEIAVFDGTTGEVIKGAGVRHYGASATDPVSPTPQAGDEYYNTDINYKMAYDATRGKWLSTALMFEGCGRNGNTSANTFYRRFNGMLTSVTRGPFVQKGTIVRIGYATATAVNHTFEVLVNGVVVTTLASGGAATASDATLNIDFPEGIMSMRNAAGGSTTSFMQATIYYKLRA